MYIEFFFDRRAIGKKTFRNPRNTDWDIFERRVKLGLYLLISSRIVSEEELEATTEKFTNAIIKAFEEACLKRVYKGTKKNPWTSVEKSIAEFKFLQKDPMMSNTGCSTRPRLLFIKENLEGLRGSLGEIFAVTLKRLAKLQDSGTDGSWTSSEKESLELLTDTHFLLKERTRASVVETKRNCPLFTSKRPLKRAVNSLKPFKST